MDKEAVLIEANGILITCMETINNYNYSEIEWQLFHREMRNTHFDSFDEIMDFVRSRKYGLASTLASQMLVSFTEGEREDYTARFKNIPRHYDFIDWDKDIFKIESMSRFLQLITANSDLETVSRAQQDINGTVELLDEVVAHNVGAVQEIASRRLVIAIEITSALKKAKNTISAGFKKLKEDLDRFAQVLAIVAANFPPPASVIASATASTS